MAIRLIIDSASDILPEAAKASGMVHLAQRVRFGESEYLDGVELSHSDFYRKLIESDEMPGTSQIPPADFADAFESVLKAGDTPIAITMSSKLSGTCQSARIAAAECAGDAYVVDSENVAIGERILIQRGVELIGQGLPAGEIVDILNEEKKAYPDHGAGGYSGISQKGRPTFRGCGDGGRRAGHQAGAGD